MLPRGNDNASPFDPVIPQRVAPQQSLLQFHRTKKNIQLRHAVVKMATGTGHEYRRKEFCRRKELNALSQTHQMAVDKRQQKGATQCAYKH